MNTINESKQKSLGIHLLIIACLSAGLGLVACQQEGPAEKAGQKIDKATANAEQKIEQSTAKAEKELESAKAAVVDKSESAGEYIDDSVITMKVKAAIVNDSLLKASQIEVTTVNGVVKLNGRVDSEQSIGRAMEIANSQKDVKAVQTELVVNAARSDK